MKEFIEMSLDEKKEYIKGLVKRLKTEVEYCEDADFECGCCSFCVADAKVNKCYCHAHVDVGVAFQVDRERSGCTLFDDVRKGTR